VFGIGVLILALEVLGGHRSELSGFGAVLGHLRWWWLPPAVLVEAGSLVAFAGVQYRLLGAGGLRAPAGPLIGITLASQAITNSLPGGTAVATVYGFRWYRRLGADDALAAWAMVGSAVAAALSLALLAAGGVVLATEQGASLDLVPVVVGVLVATMAAGALFAYERPLAVVVKWSLRTTRRLVGRPRGDLEAQINRVVERVTVVRLDWRQMGGIVGWALLNWLFDCSCFAFSFLLVGAGIPWKGLLLAYGAGQLAANLPITPGGLGAVEGSLTIALAYFGGARASTVDAVLIYRIISFWGVLAVGWLAWGWGALGVRRGRWPRQAMDAPLGVAASEAGR
jgi:putative heme transporter